jgi:hypothetical protein
MDDDQDASARAGAEQDQPLFDGWVIRVQNEECIFIFENCDRFVERNAVFAHVLGGLARIPLEADPPHMYNVSTPWVLSRGHDYRSGERRRVTRPMTGPVIRATNAPPSRERRVEEYLDQRTPCVDRGEAVYLPEELDALEYALDVGWDSVEPGLERGLELLLTGAGIEVAERGDLHWFNAVAVARDAVDA